MRAYSRDVFNSCVSYLNDQDYSYIPDEESGVISFIVKEVFDFLLEIDEKNFVLSIKLPIRFDESKCDDISSYIFYANANPMFAHFTMDYDTRVIYCIYSVFCNGDEFEANVMDDAIDSITACIKAFYTGFIGIIENNTSAKEAYELNYE